MNKLSYKIAKRQLEDPLCYDIFQIIIDGKETAYYFDVAALDMSGSEEGIFPMLVCECGYMGCTGNYVNVRLTSSEVIWEKFYSGGATDKPDPEDELKEIELTKTWKKGAKEFIIKPPLRFDRQEYINLTKDILSKLPQHEKALTAYKSDIEQYKRGDRFRM